jgi:hypothetical protein
VTPDAAPVLDPRDAAALLAELCRRRPAYLPEWRPTADGAGEALLRIVARYAQIVVDRLNKAPERDRLAFLDMLGISLVPAEPARAPVVFKAIASAGDSRVGAGARVGADVAGGASPVVFETESAIALAGARLTDVITLWPDRDAYADHSSDAAGGRPFTLFRPLKAVAHEIYLAHDTLFAVAGKAAIQIEFELAVPGSAALGTAWEFWDGQVWQPFRDFDAADPEASKDGTAGFTRSGSITLRVACGHPERTTVGGIEAFWIRGRTTDRLPADPARVLASLDRVRARTVIDQAAGGIALDTAFADATRLDLSRTFFPFGQQPTPGSVFSLASAEAFAKPGARVTITWTLASSPPVVNDLNPLVAWEYWNGQRWTVIPGTSLGAFFGSSGVIVFIVPPDIAATTVNGRTAFWIRAHLTSGGYGDTQEIVWSTGLSDPDKTKESITVTRTTPPAIASIGVGYTWRSPWSPVERCLTRNDFRLEDRSRDVRSPGTFFPPFRPVDDATPALYLGFDRPLPNDLVSLYLDLEESDASAPALVWEAWDGATWRAIPATDGTGALTRPGIVSFIAPPVTPRPEATVREAAAHRVLVASALEAAPFRPGQLVIVRQADRSETATIESVRDRVLLLHAPLAGTYTGGTLALAPLPRFGTPRDWVRARLKDDGAPAMTTCAGVHLNAVSAVQRQTIAGEVLGSGSGQPGQTLFFSQSPILPGEEIEVRELEGARAAVELPILRDELVASGFTDDDIRVVSDPKTGKAREVWVRWRGRPHFFFSGPTDRHYVVERARGRLLFPATPGGRLPTVGSDNIRARVYRAGGGLVGNVPRGAITQLLGGAFVEGVFNPRGATGGADGESPDAVRTRGPQALRHRWRALAARDYEAMAREASPAVAAVRVLPATAPNGRPAPGWVTVIIVPQSHEPRPQPSLELRRQVHDYLAVRAPATLAASRIAVIGPTYRPVGVAARVAPRVAGEAGVVAARVKEALATFLHPFTGGPDGRGWDFGRDVFLSDVAAVLEIVPGVDYVRELDLLIGEAPVGTRVPVPAGEIVVAGPLRVEMEASEA